MESNLPDLDENGCSVETLIDKVIPVKGKFVKETRGYREADVQLFIRKLRAKINKRIDEVSDPENCANKKSSGDCKICDNIKYALKDVNDQITELAGDALVGTDVGGQE